jgi:uncharacterized protein (TIGR00725 family)
MPGKVVSVFGSNDSREGDAAYALAMDVGCTLARLGFTVANGGYGGTMEASARGAKSADGTTIGVTCGIWKSRPNAHIDREISTANLPERLMKLVEVGEGGYVVLPGGTGTLLELAMVWELSNKRFLAKRPIVCVGEFWRGVVDSIRPMSPSAMELVDFAADAAALDRFFK